MEDISFTCVMQQPMRLMMPDQRKTSASHATANETDDAGPMEDLSFTCVMPQPMRLMMPGTNGRPQLHLCDATANETDDAGPMEVLSFTCVMPQLMRLMMPDQWKTSASPV